jgi:hypothetical protein
MMGDRMFKLGASIVSDGGSLASMIGDGGAGSGWDRTGGGAGAAARGGAGSGTWGGACLARSAMAGGTLGR